MEKINKFLCMAGILFAGTQSVVGMQPNNEKIDLKQLRAEQQRLERLSEQYKADALFARALQEEQESEEFERARLLRESLEQKKREHAGAQLAVQHAQAELERAARERAAMLASKKKTAQVNSKRKKKKKVKVSGSSSSSSVDWDAEKAKNEHVKQERSTVTPENGPTGIFEELYEALANTSNVGCDSK